MGYNFSCEKTAYEPPRETEIMTLVELKEIAKQHNIKAGKMKKADLIRAIQCAEGNEQCFDTGKSAQCGQEECLWRDDCD